jgi:predicted ATP-grasp superfamily ATP-dependent carboligase
MPETGLAIARSLYSKGISVFAIDSSVTTGMHSKYINPIIIPHPLLDGNVFIQQLSLVLSKFKFKPVLFIASDIYLTFFLLNYEYFKQNFHFNYSDPELIRRITDKYEQYKLVKNVGISTPKTIAIDSFIDIQTYIHDFQFPLFLKARDVNIWRKEVHSSQKGFLIKDIGEIEILQKKFQGSNVPVIIQEVVLSTDDKNFKSSVYISKAGEILLNFTLRKIHQNPIHFGIASCAESISHEKLKELGEKLFTSIGYHGVGSAEFKFDEMDGELKLIEINPRYWQQNYLADFCGMNFPFIDYLESTGQNPPSIKSFALGIKWLNLSLDLDSLAAYRKRNELTIWKWFLDIRGKKTISFIDIKDLVVTLRYLKLLVVRSLMKLVRFEKK